MSKDRKVALIRCKGAVQVRGQVRTSIEATKERVTMVMRPSGVEVCDPESTMPYKDSVVPWSHIEQVFFFDEPKPAVVPPPVVEKEPEDKK